MSLFKFYTRLTQYIKRLDPHPAVERFMQHNQRVFSRIDKGNSRVPEVLFELNMFRSSHIAYSYLATVLADLSDAKIVAYTPSQMKGATQRLKFFISRIAFKEPLGTYRSFGTTGFLAVTVSKKQKKKAEVGCGS